MNRCRVVAVLFVLAGGLSAQAQTPDWKAARIWVSGGETGVWVVAANQPKDSTLPVMQFWYSPVQNDEALPPRQQVHLPPVSGNPVQVAADSGGLRVLFSDLTTGDYFAKRPFSPGASWRAQCKIAPIAWCGDSTEPVLWALVESASLTSADASEEAGAIPSVVAPDEAIKGRWAVLRLRDGIWRRGPGPTVDESARRFWMAATGGDLHIFWADEKAVLVATLHDDEWSSPETVLQNGPIRHAWTGANAGGPVFLACRSASDKAGTVEVFQSHEGAWSVTGRLREGNEFLSIDPKTAAMDVAGQQVVVARRTDPGLVEFGECDLAGTRPVRFETLSLQREQPSSATQWQDAVILGLVLGVMTLVLWRRRDQVAAPIVLPPGLVPAAVWRRVFGGLLDFAPAAVAIMPWWYAVAPDSAKLGDVQTVFNQMDDPEVMATLAPVYYVTILAYGVWCAVWEVLIGTSPGKYLFGCRVLSIIGGRPTARQVIQRNVMRVILVSMGMAGLIVTLMMIVMVTRNRQRLGDIWAGTVVVEPGLPPEDPGSEERPERGEDDGEHT